MNILIALVVIILLMSMVGTLLLTGKSDQNYSGSTQRNTTNLTMIYVVVILFSLIALGVYIRFFA